MHNGQSGKCSTTNNNDERISDSNTIASKLSEYFSSIAQILDTNSDAATELDLSKLTFVNNKVADTTFFQLPYITTEQVLLVINSLDPSKATGLDGISPKIIKMAANCLSPVIADLINKSINSGSFPSQILSLLLTY